MALRYDYSKKRKDFGRNTRHFALSDSGIVCHVDENKLLKQEYSQKIFNDVGLQSMPGGGYSVHFAQTNFAEKVNFGHVTDKPRKSAPFRSENLSGLDRSGKKLHKKLRLNNAMPFKRSYFPIKQEPKENKVTHCQTLIHKSRIRRISFDRCGCVLATVEGKAYSFCGRVWNLGNTISPFWKLPNVNSLDFHHYFSKMLLGSNTVNNKIELYTNKRVVLSTSYEGVEVVQWDRTDYRKCRSLTTDSIVLWDTRKFTSPVKVHKISGGCTVMEDGFVGTLSGLMVDTGQQSMAVAYYDIDNETAVPVYHLQISPHNPKFILNAAGYRLKVWGVGHKGGGAGTKYPVLKTAHMDSYLHTACWDDKIDKFCYSGNENGVVCLHDLRLQKTVLSEKVSSDPISSIVVFGDLLAVGDCAGRVNVLRKEISYFDVWGREQTGFFDSLEKEMQRLEQL